jgi:transposase
MDAQFRQVVINVHLYFSKFSTNPMHATAAACKVDRKTVRNIITEGTQPQRPHRLRRKKAELDDFDMSVIRRIVHDFFRKKEPPTIQKVLDEVKKELQERFPYGASMLRTIMHQLGFRYGRRRGKSLQLMERADVVHWRTRYLRQIRQYRQDNRTIVYLDETWFNCNEGPSRVWQDTRVQRPGGVRKVKHPNSGLTFGLPEASGRGQRLLIVNAIQESGPVPCALMVFPSKNPVTPEDYHKDMDADNFERWFRERLLPNLAPKSVIVMDNAPYHSRKDNSVKAALTKAEYTARLTEIGFFIFLAERNLTSDPETMTKKKMKELWERYRSQFEYYAVDKMADEANHTVLRLPPYHCTLNPIEMLWAYQKEKARGRGGIVRSVAKATETCELAFREIPTEDLSRYFDHVITEENQYWTADGVDLLPPHPPVIIPLHDSDSESDEDGTGAETADEE